MSDIEGYAHFMSEPKAETPTCEFCGDPDGFTRICPYQDEINDTEILCTCCENCKDECAGDI